MDAGTPNPKPRLSRRLLSHFTLTLSVLLALSFVTLAVVGPTTQEAEAIAPIVIPAVLLGIGIGAYISNWLYEDQAAASGQAISSYRQITASSYNNSLELSKSATLNEAELADLTTNFYARLGEMGALALYQTQKEAESPFVYDRNAVFNLANIYELAADQYKMASTGYNSTINSLYQYQDRFIGDYSEMSIKAYNYANNIGTDQNAANKGIFGVANLLSSGVYLIDTSQPLYLTHKSSSYTWTYTFKDLSGNTLGSVEYSGDTKIQERSWETILGENYDATIRPMSLTVTGTTSTNARIIATTYPYLNETNNGIKSPCIYWYSENNLARQAIWYYDPSNPELANIIQSTSDGVTDTTGLQIIGNGISKIDLKDDIVALGKAYNKLCSIFTVVHNYAQTYYNYLVVNGDEGIPYTPPSILPINPEQMANMTTAELYAIYIAYMSALMEGFENGYTVTPGDVNISVESLKLVCRGTIYNATGAVIANNQSIFTPFPTFLDMELNLGNNTMNQPGFIIKWGESATIEEQMRDPSNESFTPETMRYISYGVNWTLDIEEMYYMGIPAESVTLYVTNLTVYEPHISPPPAGGDILSDWEWLLSRWYYFAIIAGIICLLAAISLRNVAIIAVGLILLAAGGIGYWMAGDFSLLDAFGLSLESSNLRAWLQQLR